MALGKKGLFFSLIAILLVSIVIVSFTFYASYRTKASASAVETRVNTMDRFIENLEKDIGRALYISGFRAILAAEDRIIASGEYLDDSESAIEELSLNGTLEGTKLNITSVASLSDWFEKVKTQGREIGVDVEYSIIDFSVSQSDAWAVDFSVQIEINLTDTKGVASWNRIKTSSSSVDIIGLEDPVYTIGAFGKSARMINKTDDEIEGIDDLEDFLDSKLYRHSTDAPSFLMRLEGDLSSSPYGIETLVDTNELALADAPTYSRSSVDYIYFGEQSTTDYKIHNITDDGMPGFLLDSEHIDEFDVDDFKYS